MGSPKHLWSGDWRGESASAAEERARRQAQTGQPVEVPTPPVSTPSVYARALLLLRHLRTRLAAVRIGRTHVRLGAVLALAALLVVGSAYGVSALRGSGGSGSATDPQTAWLGLQMESLPPSAVVITTVAPGGPAAAAGLRPGDLITQIDGRPVVTPIDVTEDVEARNPGDTVEIQIARGSATYTTAVRLKARPAGYP